MSRPITILGAPSSLGIRPYDGGGPRRLDRAPEVLRELGLVERLEARDAGAVTPPPYVDLSRQGIRPRNESAVVEYSQRVGERVAKASRNGGFVLVLGGDCSLVLGCLLGLHGRNRSVGLAYVDAHADFATPEESITGSVASMCLAMAVGRGETPLARLGGRAPLVKSGEVVLIGRRDHSESWYGHDALAASEVLDLPHATLEERGSAGTAEVALERLRGVPHGFWIHLDADFLDPETVPAVDSPLPGGLAIEAASELLSPLVNHPRALGLELTIYDPGLDPDRRGGRALVELLERLLAPAA